MDDHLPLGKRELAELQRGREQLIEQIPQSKKTIEHSRALLRRIDALLPRQSRSSPDT
jgi:hypothetical protein